MSKPKKKLLVFSNFSRLLTGFGGHKKRLLRWFFNQPDWEVVEAAAGIPWDAPEAKRMPWKCYGTHPTPEQQQQIASIQDPNARNAAERNASYGNYRIDEILKIEKPNFCYFCEDSWAFDDVVGRKWNDIVPTLYHYTADSLPLLPSQIDMAAKCKHLAVWATFAQKEYEKLGYNHVQTIAGTVDPNEFHPISEDRRNSLRKKFGLEDTFVFFKLGRSQLRKSFPNMMDGFKLFKEKNPTVKAKLLFHTFYGGEGWDLPKLVHDKGLDSNDVLTTYYCRNCKQWEIKPFSGLDQDCPHCKAQKTYSTCSITHGVHEEDLCDIYGLSDLVMNLASSGGFEYAVWQGKMCEKIVAATEYSCHLDGCYENSGGWPVKWASYMEPGSCFLKASSLPESVCELMEKFVNLSADERGKLEKRAREFTIEWASTDNVCRRIADYFESLEPANWEGFSFEPVPKNPAHVPPNNLSPEEFSINLLTEMMHERVDKNTSHVKNWAAHLRKSNDYQGVYKHFVNLALQFNANLNNKPVDLAELLDKNDKKIAVVLAESAGDIVIVNSLLGQFKALYPEYNIYFFTKPEFFELVEGNPAVHKVLAWFPAAENIFFMEGNGSHSGYFEAVFYPASQTQRHISYNHNRVKYRAEWLI